MVEKNKSTDQFADIYPNISDWVSGYGWIEIGQDEESDSFMRALNEGGMVWEGKKKYKTMDAALKDLEHALADWLQENG